LFKDEQDSVLRYRYAELSAEMLAAAISSVKGHGNDAGGTGSGMYLDRFSLRLGNGMLREVVDADCAGMRPWREPEALRAWRAKHLEGERSGGPGCLILIGGARFGKTEWAVRAGARALCFSWWSVARYDADASHLVLNDPNFRDAEYRSMLDWQAVLGCKERRKVGSRWVKWGFPVIVTCNDDFDPRLVPEVAEFLETVCCTVVNLGEKLYV
jgi:hypothetical protein